MNEEVKPTGGSDEIKAILVGFARMEEKMQNMSKQIEEVSSIAKLAMATDQAAKSAHNRLDDLKEEHAKDIAKLREENAKEFQDLKEDYRERTANTRQELKDLKASIMKIWLTVFSGGISVAGGIIVYFVTTK